MRIAPLSFRIQTALPARPVQGCGHAQAARSTRPSPAAVADRVRGSRTRPARHVQPSALLGPRESGFFRRLTGCGVKPRAHARRLHSARDHRLQIWATPSAGSSQQWSLASRRGRTTISSDARPMAAQVVTRKRAMLRESSVESWVRWFSVDTVFSTPCKVAWATWAIWLMALFTEALPSIWALVRLAMPVTRLAESDDTSRMRMRA